MINLEKNKRLNPRNILNIPIYRSIMHILSTYEKEKIKFSHLKYALVNKEYRLLKSKMEKFYSQPLYEDSIKALKNEFEKRKIPPEIFSKLMEYMKSNSLENLLSGYLTKDDKLNSESSLRDKLYELKYLGLIEKKPDEKGYSYYILTDLGKNLYSRYSIHHLIDLHILDNELKELNVNIITFIFKKRGVSIR